jgi:hypothetical protein
VNREIGFSINSKKGGGLLRQLHTLSVLSFDIVLMLLVLCALAKPAYGYVDPGSGLFALQVITTTFAGVGFLVRKRLRNLFSAIFLGSRRKDVPED